MAEKAMREFDKAFDQDPEYFVIFNERAECYSLKGDLQKALADATVAVQWQIGTPVVYESRTSRSL